jgi:endonuclease/exonuclease/phosphatase family metal-dependent hydrolase
VVGLAAVGVVAVWLPAVGALLGLALPPSAVGVLSFLPWLAGAAALATFLVWTALPDRPTAAVLFGVAAVAPIAWWGPRVADASAGASASGPQVRVVTWNVRRLWGLPDDERPSLGCVADQLRATGADVVALQEVTARDLEGLDSALGLDCAWGTYRAADDATDDAGLAVCAVDGRSTLAGGAVDAYAVGDDWRFVSARVVAAGVPLHVLGVHLQPFRILDRGLDALPAAWDRLPAVTAAHRVQAEALVGALGAGPTVVLGDFNSAPDTPLHVGLRQHLRDAPPSGADAWGTVRLLGFLPLRIDYVYASRDLDVVASAAPATACSDHRPVVTDLRIPR